MPNLVKPAENCGRFWGNKEQTDLGI